MKNKNKNVKKFNYINDKNKNKNKNIKKFEYKIIDSPDKDFVYIGTNYFTPPETDKVCIYILNEEVDANLIFKMIDDMTEYLTGEIGLSIGKDVLIVYDEDNAPIDRFDKFF